MIYKKWISNLVTCALGAFLLASCSQTDPFYANTQRNDLFQQNYDESKYDFLWVFDSSGSMAQRRDYVKSHMQDFLNTLDTHKAIDYQMAVTSTDMFTQKGQLYTSSGGISVVKSATSSDPAGDFGAILDAIQDTNTSFWEQGLESAYQAVFQYGSQFSRPGVPLIIIFMSDSEDWSCKSNCWGVEPEHNTGWVPFTVDRYINYFQGLKASQGSDVALYPIVATQSSQCDYEALGRRYMQVTSAVGNFGVSSSICDNDLPTSFNNVAQIIANRGTVFPLSTPANGSGISVYVDSQLVPNDPSNYVYDPTQNAIVFTGVIPSEGQIVSVSYSENTD